MVTRKIGSSNNTAENIWAKMNNIIIPYNLIIHIDTDHSKGCCKSFKSPCADK